MGHSVSGPRCQWATVSVDHGVSGPWPFSVTLAHGPQHQCHCASGRSARYSPDTQARAPWSSMYMLDLALPFSIYLYPGYVPVMLKFNEPHEMSVCVVTQAKTRKPESETVCQGPGNQ